MKQAHKHHRLTSKYMLTTVVHGVEDNAMKLMKSVSYIHLYTLDLPSQ